MRTKANQDANEQAFTRKCFLIIRNRVIKERYLIERRRNKINERQNQRLWRSLKQSKRTGPGN